MLQLVSFESNPPELKKTIDFKGKGKNFSQKKKIDLPLFLHQFLHLNTF